MKTKSSNALKLIFTTLAFAPIVSTALGSQATHTVIMKSINFDPKTISIKAGDTVQWENKSYTEHSATAEQAGAFDTGLVEPKKASKKIAFKQAGRFIYHCSVHGKTMSGEVIVEP